MAVVNRIGNDGYGIIQLEASYGTQVTTFTADKAVLGDCTIDMKPVKILVDTNIKTGKLVRTDKEKLLAGSSGIVTIKGNLCSEYGILLSAITRASGSPYAFTDPQPAGFTYNIYNIYPSDTPDTYDLALGCKCESFKITGVKNGIMQFEAMFTCKSIARKLTTTLTSTPALAAGTPFLFGNVTTPSNLFSGVGLNSFDLTLTAVFDENTTWQNNMTPKAGKIVSYELALNAETIYDETADSVTEAAIGSQTAVDVNISLVNGSATWAMAMTCRILDFALADPGKAYITSQFTLEGAADAGNTAPIVVTVS